MTNLKSEAKDLIPFNEWSRERIKQNRKFMTSRHKRYDKDPRVIHILDKMQWGEIRDRFWQLEGADNPMELQRAIENIYHRVVPLHEEFYPHLGDFR